MSEGPVSEGPVTDGPAPDDVDIIEANEADLAEQLSELPDDEEEYR